MFRFSVVHVATYLVIGVVFFFVSDCTGLFAADQYREQLRPTDDPLVRTALLFQIPRGLLLATVLYPFRSVLVTRLGWVKLFALLWVLTGIGAVITGPGSIEGALYTRFGFGGIFVGWREITTQMLAFSWLFHRRHGEEPMLVGLGAGPAATHSATPPGDRVECHGDPPGRFKRHRQGPTSHSSGRVFLGGPVLRERSSDRRNS